jgi:asparagine synthase (glutamine-hydrolysing)
MGMAHSVEGRVPLLDPILVEWAASLPQSVKTPRFEQKALFRRAVSPILPSYITSRPKQGFSPPVERWAAKLLLERLPARSAVVDDGLVAADAVERLTAKDSTNSSFALWTLGTLMVWTEQNL